MAHSTFQPTQAMTFPLSQGHSAVAGGAIQVVRPYSDNAGYWPAGFLITNVDDLARFAIALSSGGTLGGHQAIPAEAVELMSSPHSRMGEGAAYGYGLMLRELRGVRIVEHGGAIEGFSSLFRLAPDYGFGVIILANKDGAAFEKTADRAMELLLPLEPSAEPEEDDEPIALSQAELKRYAGVYAQMAEEALEVRIDDGQLVLVLPGGELSLTPLGDDRFTLFGPGMSAQPTWNLLPDRTGPSSTDARLPRLQTAVGARSRSPAKMPAEMLRCAVARARNGVSLRNSVSLLHRRIMSQASIDRTGA